MPTANPPGRTLWLMAAIVLVGLNLRPVSYTHLVLMLVVSFILLLLINLLQRRIETP